MKVLVVYESLWGNTAEAARAIAEGFGQEASPLSTAEATSDVVTQADVIIAGAPVHIAGLPKERTREKAAERAADQEQWPGLPSPDLSHPPMREWLDALPRTKGKSGAGFDTRSSGRWSGNAAGKIASKLASRGYRKLAPPEGFIVASQEGPLADGELDRARAWGAELASRAKQAG